MRRKKQLNSGGQIKRTPFKEKATNDGGLRRGFLKSGGNINKVSDKEKERQKQYGEQLRKDLQTTQSCKRCGTGQDLQRHHVSGRVNILDYIYLCVNCHHWVHQYPAQARKAGWLT